MRTPALPSCGLALLLALTSLGHAAADAPPIRPNPATPSGVHNTKPAEALYRVHCKSSGYEREAFAKLITTTHPRHYALYSAIDEHADLSVNIGYDLLSGTREDLLREIGYDTMVIISNFRDISLKFEKLSYEDSVKYWDERFEKAKKVRPLKLILLSTDKKPEPELIALAERTGGSYRNLKLNADGNYE